MSLSVDETRAKLGAFLANILPSQGEHLVDRIVLRHTPRNSNRLDNLRTWKRSNEVDRPLFDPGKQSVDKLVRVILDLAEHTLESLGGAKPERFRVTIEQVDGTPTVYPFTLEPQPIDDNDEDDERDGDRRGDSDDPQPTRDELLAETMKQNRELHARLGDMMDRAISGMGRSNVAMASEIERLHAMLAKNNAERAQWLASVEEAQQKKHEREMEAALVAAEVERKDLVTKKAMGLLPVLTNRFLESRDAKNEKTEGGKGEHRPKPYAALAAKFAAFGASLSHEQTGKIVLALAMEQQIMLNEVKNIAAKGGGAMLARIAHDLFDSLHGKQLDLIIGAVNEDQGQMLVDCMKMAEEGAAAAEAADEPPPKKTEPQPAAVQ